MKRPYKRKVRPIRIDGDVAYVRLTDGLEAVIDAADIPLISAWNWFARKSKGGKLIYAARSEHTGRAVKTVLMHREILAPPEHLQVDHINHSGLDNRRSNIRVAAQSENMGNTRIRRDNSSGVKGVVCVNGRWRARIGAGGRASLGTFHNKDEAMAAYAAAASNLFGEFAHQGGCK